MSDLSVETQALKTLAQEVTSCGEKMRDTIEPAWNDALMLGVNWPVISLGLRTAYQSAHTDYGMAIDSAQQALDSLGTKITEIANAYEEMELNP